MKRRMCFISVVIISELTDKSNFPNWAIFKEIHAHILAVGQALTFANIYS